VLPSCISVASTSVSNQSKRLEQRGTSGRLIFVGGIYGSGKTTTCAQLATLLGAIHLRASELARHQVKGTADDGKAVDDVESNQRALLANLDIERLRGDLVILDGHYCIYDRKSSISRIGFDIFESIRPAVLLLIDIEPELALHRLTNREQGIFNFSRLSALRTQERTHAEAVSDHLAVALNVVGFDATPESIADQISLAMRD
jgi:adenylate kinase